MTHQQNNTYANQCPICTNIFKQRAHLKHHLFKRKKVCRNNGISILETNKSIFIKKSSENNIYLECVLCNKPVTTLDSLYMHIDTCKSIIEKTKNTYTKSNTCDDISLKNPPDPAIFTNHTLTSAKNISYMCDFCKQTFTRNDSLIRHLNNTCKIKKNNDREHNDIFNSLIIKMNDLANENKKLQKSIKSLTIKSKQSSKVNYMTNCNNNIVNNTINIIGFGKEKLNYTDEVIKTLLSHGFNAITKTIEYTNFNKNMPQYHNVYIPNIKSPYAAVFDGEEWKLEELNLVLNQLYDDKRCYLEDKFDEFILSLNDVIKKKFQRFIDVDDDDSPQAKWIKKKIKLMLYNKRKIPMKTIMTNPK
jgi:hypothetical protein